MSDEIKIIRAIGLHYVLPSGDVVVSTEEDTGGCSECVGRLPAATGTVCDSLPMGCGNYSYRWLPHDPDSDLAHTWEAYRQALDVLDRD